MIRYSKYFLQNALWLDDGFCQYYVQDDFWGLQEILDVETLVFFWPEDACQWLQQCAEYDQSGTLHRLRDYLTDYSLRPYVLHRMDDAQVMRAAAEELTENMSRVVIQPNVGWAVQMDKETHTPELPPQVEPEPELTHMLSELKEQLDGLVAEQKEKSARIEAQLANLTPEQRALFYSKKAGTGVYDSAVGDTWDMVKAAPSVLWSAAKAFPGFYAGYLKAMWKIAQTPSKMASLTAHGIATGDYAPLKQEIDKIVIPVTTTYEQAVKYKSMLTVLFGDEQVYALLHDFATRYYEATHSAELTQMAASAVADIVVTVILAIVTAGAGAAANVAAKSGRLVKVAKLLEKIASTLRRIGPKTRFLDKAHDAASTAAKVEKKAAKAARKRGVPDIDSPKPAKKIDKKASKGYGGHEKSSGPKKTKDYDRKNNGNNNDGDKKAINKVVSLKTTPLNPRYAGENIPNNPNNWLRGRSTVKYLSDSEIEAYKLTTRDGKFFDANGKIFDTSSSQTWDGQSKAIFVVNEKGDVFASTYQKVGEFHHSSLGQGKAVAMAGEMEVDNGILKSISNRSGHYTPKPEYLDQTISHLEQSGIDFKSVEIDILEP